MKQCSQESVFRGLWRSLAALVAAVLAAALFGVFVERPYLSFENQPFPIIGQAHAGELVQVSMRRCSSAAAIRAYLSTNRLENRDTGEVHLLPDTWLMVDPGCTDVSTTVHPLPSDIEPGTYILSGVAVVPGLMREHRIAWSTEPFVVTAR